MFTISINTMPALASSLEQVPGLGTLVRTLQFNKGTAGGGAITDSTDVNMISLHKKDGQEQNVIHFQQNNQPQQIANSFNVKYSEYPNMMTGGARKRNELIQTHGFNEQSLFIERREALQIPEAITIEEPAP